jgi:hypothetical protein
MKHPRTSQYKFKSMKPAKTSGAAGVALRIIGAPLPKVSAVEKAGGADLGAKNYIVSSNRAGPVNRRTRSVQGMSQAVVGAGAVVRLAEVVVTPRRNKAARARELKRIFTRKVGRTKKGDRWLGRPPGVPRGRQKRARPKRRRPRSPRRAMWPNNLFPQQ